MKATNDFINNVVLNHCGEQEKYTDDENDIKVRRDPGITA